MKIILTLLLCICLMARGAEALKECAGSERGPEQRAFYNDAVTPMRMLVEGSRNPGVEGKGFDCEIINDVYMQQAAVKGASELRTKVQSDLNSGLTVVIRFAVRGGWSAMPAYREEFQQEIKDGDVKWSPWFVSDMESLNESVPNLAAGDVYVLVDDFVHTGFTLYLFLKLLRCGKGACSGFEKVIFQALIEKRPEKKELCLVDQIKVFSYDIGAGTGAPTSVSYTRARRVDDVLFLFFCTINTFAAQKIRNEPITILLNDIGVGESGIKDRLYRMRYKLHPELLILESIIDDLDCSVVVPETFEKNWIVLPYDGDGPGMWPDVHDYLTLDHKDKKLIVAPAIVYCDANGLSQNADFEFALCQSKRSDLCLSSVDKKDLLKVIYTTIFVHQKGDEIKFISELLHMDQEQRDLLETYAGKVIMVLSDSALKTPNLAHMLSEKFQIPVNRQSADHMQRHSHLGRHYKLKKAVPVRDSITRESMK
ncbi:MAG: hypothetical protein OXC30_06425 [Alphaproteobacteria bacterium]|nr:hypothetical protein [Alphaproteobacteria bacterium]